jgi:hypothetical protein
MNKRRIQEIANDIFDCAEGRDAAEFHAGLTLATGIFFKAQFPHDLEEAYKRHTENLKNVFEDLDKRG